MNKGLIIGIVVFLLILLGGGYFMFANRGAGPTSPATPFSSDNGAPSTLADLLGLTNQMCTYEDPQTGDTGTFYVAGNRMRGDVMTSVNGATEVSHMIYMDNTMYIWMDGETTGFQMTADFSQDTSGEVPDSDTPPQTPQAFDTGREFDYDCGSWSVDASMFELPDGVEFVDFSEFALPSQLENGNGTEGSETPDQCAYCDSLTGDEKASCLAALGC